MGLVTSLSSFLYGCLTQQTRWNLGGKWPCIFLIRLEAMYILNLMSGVFILSHLKKALPMYFKLEQPLYAWKKSRY